MTGYVEHRGEWFIFCNVGNAGRTGHDYENRFDGVRLTWFGKGPSTLQQPAIQRLLYGGGRVHVFFRKADRDPFTFAGLGNAVEAYDQQPVKVVWEFSPRPK